jgi:DNA-binding HxlR family transcriptional regulator
MPLLETEKIADYSRKVRMVREVLDQVATKWTLLVLDALEGKGEVRQSKLLKAIPGISQKMLTQTLRQLERDGLITRKVKSTIPPQVSYKLTPQGEDLSDATCAIWEWVEKNLRHVERSREEFDSRKKVPTEILAKV